jgi:dienelactone hydrolase
MRCYVAIPAVSDVNGSLDYMTNLPEIAPGRIGVMSFCMGGQVSYLTAGHKPNLKVTVCFYPGSLFNPLGSGKTPLLHSLSDSVAE